ncbi:MAG: patatin-like phospholipase family protein [Desulfobacterales bacterium]|nr:patatin-like phospholipase family protein [Desulfobacterales bacterium]
MPIKGNKYKYIKTRIWDASASDFQYPELVDSGPDSVNNKPNVGICFSGGGTRSASATHGQMRALDHLGLLENVRYISCVSGGSWAAVPYTYLPKSWEDDHFFGTVMEPGNITLDMLKQINKRNYLHTVTHAGIIDDVVEHWLKLAGDETYSRAVGDIFLDHFGLHSLKRFFAYTKNQVDEILKNNPKADANDFYTVRENRPFLIVCGTLLRPGPKDALFEMTPWYSGISQLYKGFGSNKQNIGGGFIESFAFDSDAPENYRVGNTTALVRLGKRRHRFTLSDMIGTSGAAPAEVLDKFGLNDLGFPEFKYWPVLKTAGKALKAKEYEFGDGGNIENLGIMPLLKRGVKKIVVFVNTKKKLKKNDLNVINGAVKDLFTPNHVNHIFPENELKILIKALNQRLNNDESVTHRATYSLIKNSHYGLSAGQNIEILWVYNERFKSWENDLPESVKNRIGHGDLANYPHFSTFFENFSPIDLKPIQASLLSHLSSAVVFDNRADMIQMLT